MKRFILTFTAAFASLMLFAQNPTGGVKGTVVNRNGRVPVENARLVLKSGAADIATVPADLFAKFQISFYSSPEDAVIKALGIE